MKTDENRFPKDLFTVNPTSTNKSLFYIKTNYLKNQPFFFITHDMVSQYAYENVSLTSCFENHFPVFITFCELCISVLLTIHYDSS